MEIDDQYWWGFSNKAWHELACERIGRVVVWEALKPCTTVVAPRPYILIDQLNPIMFMV